MNIVSYFRNKKEEKEYKKYVYLMGLYEVRLQIKDRINERKTRWNEELDRLDINDKNYKSNKNFIDLCYDIDAKNLKRKLEFVEEEIGRYS